MKLFPTKKMKPILRIATKGRTLVAVWPNGWIEYGPDYDPDYDPDVAAKAFWAAIARNYPLAPEGAP